MKTESHTVNRREGNRSLLEWVRKRYSMSWKQARAWLKEGHVRVNEEPCRNPKALLIRGQVLTIDVPNSSQDKPQKKSKADRNSLPEVVIRYVDEHVVVVEKPAGLTTMRHPEDIEEQGGSRARKFLPPTLLDVLPEQLSTLCPGKQGKLRAVHRLDKDTTGLVVIARTTAAESHLGKQFRAHTIEREYLAIVRGQAQTQRIESKLVRDRGDGRRGSGDSKEGKRAVTHVEVVESLGEFTLVRCRLETGRTHQIRIHLGEAGTPLCGERVYDRPISGRPCPDTSEAERALLHAASLGFEHPVTHQQMRWTSELPADMKAMLAD